MGVLITIFFLKKKIVLIKMSYPVKYWLGTWQNPPENWRSLIFDTFLETYEYTYFALAPEIGQEKKQFHLHFIIMLYKTARLSAKKLQKTYPGIFWYHKLPHATYAENIKYIQGPYDNGKGKVKPFNPKFEEFGERPKDTTQGHRSDLDRISDEIRAGKSMEQIADENPSQFIRYGNRFRDWQRTCLKPRKESCRVELIKLKSDSNPYALIEDLHEESHLDYHIYGTKDDYRQQPVIYIIDDMDQFGLSFISFVRKALCKMPFRYDNVQFKSEVIYIITENPLDYKISNRNIRRIS